VHGPVIFTSLER